MCFSLAPKVSVGVSVRPLRAIASPRLVTGAARRVEDGISKQERGNEFP